MWLCPIEGWKTRDYPCRQQYSRSLPPPSHQAPSFEVLSSGASLFAKVESNPQTISSSASIDALRQRRVGGFSSPTTPAAAAATTAFKNSSDSASPEVDGALIPGGRSTANTQGRALDDTGSHLDAGGEMSFEQLKREAGALERQLEEKLSRYQQLAQKLQQSTSHNADALSRAEEGASSSLWDEEASLQPDLQRLLQRLQDLINTRLAAAAVTGSQQASVKRYREILLDLRGDCDRSILAVRRAKERKELLGGPSSVGAASGGSDPAMEHLLRERNHIQNSLSAAAGVIGQADAVRQDLFSQGRSLRGTGALMSQLTSNIPGLNQLVENIRRRRSRDDKIVAIVIASCILFTLWYVFG